MRILFDQGTRGFREVLKGQDPGSPCLVAFNSTNATILGQAQWEAMADRAAVIDFNEPPPILVVEVVSPSTKTDDYRFKLSEYSVLDIPEYWIVDPLEEKVTICNLNNGLYDLTEYQDNQLIQSPIFLDLKLTATQILLARL
jgi:Uma2 family endonuclease